MFPTHLGDYVETKYLLARELTAGGTDDDNELDSDSVDRQDFYSAVLAIPIEADFDGDEDATLSVTLQESSDDSSWSDLDSDLQPDDLELAANGTTASGILEHDINLKGLEQYIRAQITVTMSGASTSTAYYGACMALGGSIEKPV